MLNGGGKVKAYNDKTVAYVVWYVRAVVSPILKIEDFRASVVSPK
jgi:hypothetical protein